MAFFSRPSLSNEQFKQLGDSVLTLSGQTQIASISGLTLTDGAGTNIIITASGASSLTDGYVLTYSDATKSIALALSSASGGSTIYNCASPTTCAVGGLNASTSIAGCNLAKIIEMMVAPVLNPTLSSPSSSILLQPTTPVFEVGCQIGFVETINFNRGSVSPVYCGGTPYRTGSASCYVFTDTGGNQYSGVTNACVMSSVSILSGNNTAYGVVYYGSGVAPTKSDGSLMTGCTYLSGFISSCSTVCGTYPYFYGNSVGVPVAGSALLTTGTKCVIDSSGNVVVNYNVGSPNKYIWFATPAISQTKTKWEGSNAPTTNTESIPGGLFNAPTTVSVNSPSSCWTGINYKFYISNYPTSTIAAGTPYNITFKNS